MLKREVIATGSTIEEAQEAAARELGASPDANIEYEILSLPQKKTLGLFGGTPAKVRAYVSLSPASAAKRYLEKILEKMEMNAEVTVDEREDGAQLRMNGEDALGALIGRRGETLDSLQYLCSLAANQNSETYYRITLNAGTYREKRERTLEALARRIAASAQRTGRSTTLEPMSSYERRIIHTAVQEIDGVISWSVGEGESRRVVIGVSKDAAPARYERDRGGRPRSRDGGHARPRSSDRGFSRPNPNPDRDPVKDVSDAPLYGRIDK